MKNLLTFLIIHLVSQPDQVEVHESEENGIKTYRISAAEEDIGRIIGKHGRIIQSVRNIAKIRAIKERVKIAIIVDDRSTPAEDTAE